MACMLHFPLLFLHSILHFPHLVAFLRLGLPENYCWCFSQKFNCTNITTYVPPWAEKLVCAWPLRAKALLLSMTALTPNWAFARLWTWLCFCQQYLHQFYFQRPENFWLRPFSHVCCIVFISCRMNLGPANWNATYVGNAILVESRRRTLARGGFV